MFCSQRLMPLAVLMVVSFHLPTANAQTVIYVDANATGATHDGSTWCFAYTELHEALAAATEGTTILVAEGTYTPDAESVPDPRDATFDILNGVRLEGGYAGCGAADPGERDISMYETILSGDLDGDDDPGDFPGGPSFDDNSYHVVTSGGNDATAVLNGFTVRGGKAGGWGGGGMYNMNFSSPTVMNCTFRGNSAIGTFAKGGGMHNRYSSRPTVINCTFSGNLAAGTYAEGGGMYNGHFQSAPTVVDCAFTGNSAPNGGGVFNASGSATFTNCAFNGNSARYRGGGMFNDSSSPTVTTCTFTGNSLTSPPYPGGGNVGAGMYNVNSSPMVTNCSFSGNSAHLGGAMYSEQSVPTVTSCTFSGNKAYYGKALACDSDEHQFPSEVLIANCILRDGGDEVWSNDGSSITATHSGIQDDQPNDGVVYPGTGNIDTDPLLADPATGTTTARPAIQVTTSGWTATIDCSPAPRASTPAGTTPRIFRRPTLMGTPGSYARWWTWGRTSSESATTTATACCS